jgi:hypothetical protein
VSPVQTLRLKPAKKTVVLDDYDVDALALELDPHSGELIDFRIELGRGYFNVWVLPIERGGRLRAILVDCAVAEVEMEVEMDPCAFDFGPEEWRGELGRVGADQAHVVERVQVELRASPPSYRCSAQIRNPDGTLTECIVRSDT